MYVPKELENRVKYELGADKSGNDVAVVSFDNRRIAVLALPLAKSNLEECQRHIYRVIRSHMKMVGINN